MKKQKFKQLLEKLEDVISRNRDLLSVKDLSELLRCKEILEMMMDLEERNTHGEYIRYSVEFLLSLIKFFI